MKNIIVLLFFLFACLPSCLGLFSFSANDVKVKVAAFHSDSIVSTASGWPYIRTKGTRQICRWRPFTVRKVRSQLKKYVGFNEDTLNKYFFPEDEEEGAGESTEAESNRSIEGRPVYHQAENYWTKFGLVIQNETEFVLVIDTIRYYAKARCGDEILEHSGEFDSSYCSSEDGTTPYLYVVPPAGTGTQVSYIPQSSNPFHNLTLVIDGFPVIDRTDQPSKELENAFRVSTAESRNTFNNSGSQKKECQPDETIVIPGYTVELVLIGYFIVPDKPRDDLSDEGDRDEREGAEQVGQFDKRVTFQTTTF